MENRLPGPPRWKRGVWGSITLRGETFSTSRDKRKNKQRMMEERERGGKHKFPCGDRITKKVLKKKKRKRILSSLEKRFGVGETRKRGEGEKSFRNGKKKNLDRNRSQREIPTRDRVKISKKQG